MTIYSYMRVSTDLGQTTDTQKHAIKQAGFHVDEWVVEHAVSGSTPALERPAFKGMFDKLQPFDTVVLKSVSRLGRDVIDTLGMIKKFKEKQVVLRILEIGGADCNSPAGKILVLVLAGMAETYLEELSENVRQGLKRTAANGTILGKPLSTPPDVLRKIIEDLNSGKTQVQVGMKYDLSLKTIGMYKARYSEEKALQEYELRYNAQAAQILNNKEK